MAPPAFVFVVGSGRSGTTLLRAMFDAHPDMAMMHEPHFVVAMGRRHRRYERAAGFDTEAFLADLYADAKFRQVGLPSEEVRAALAFSSASTFADAARAVFARHAALEGKSRYGDKTPGYVLRLRLLGRLFPEARFVHLIRDGRDVAMAFADVRFGPHGVVESAIYWRRRVGRGRRAGRTLGPERYVEVRYEDLVEDPPAVLQSLCDFVGLDFDPAMLRYHERSERSVAVTGVPEAHRRLSLPPTTGLRDWRREMGDDEVRLFESIAGDLLVDAGYQRAHPHPSPAERLRAQWRWLRWQSWRARYNLRRLTAR